MSRSLLLGCAAIGALIAGFVPLSALAERGEEECDILAK